MLIRIRCASEPKSSEITPKSLYMDRRRFLTAAAGFAAGSISFAAAAKLDGIVPGPYGTDEAQTPYEAASKYNNFYEFGTGKKRPGEAMPIRFFNPKPWTVSHRRRRGRRPASLRLRGPDQAPSSWRSGSTACAASRPGPWSCRGWGSPWARISSSASNPPRRPEYVAFQTLHRPGAACRIRTIQGPRLALRRRPAHG